MWMIDFPHCCECFPSCQCALHSRKTDYIFLNLFFLFFFFYFCSLARSIDFKNPLNTLGFQHWMIDCLMLVFPRTTLTAQTSVALPPTTSTSPSVWPRAPCLRTACSRWPHHAGTARLGPSSAETRLPPDPWKGRSPRAVWWTGAWTPDWSVRPAAWWSWGGRGHPVVHLRGCTQGRPARQSTVSTR